MRAGKFTSPPVAAQFAFLSSAVGFPKYPVQFNVCSFVGSEKEEWYATLKRVVLQIFERLREWEELPHFRKYKFSKQFFEKHGKMSDSPK